MSAPVLIGPPCSHCKGSGAVHGLICGWCSGNGDTWAKPYSMVTTEGSVLIWTCPGCFALVAEPTEHKRRCGSDPSQTSASVDETPEERASDDNAQAGEQP